ncbi:MAG: TetR/AcrR family transcriptional regulator [Deltaproteobacteria bacterium]|nr:TetR/AcrR family transcriptional regulator [Deltaproteobacteria bacterium]
MGTKGQETRDRIIRAARHLFHDRGYTNTSIEDICSESGVRRGNLYFYFSSKEVLAYAAIDDALRREFPFIERATAGETNPLGKIDLMLDGMVGYVIDRGCTGG